ncbi:MAG TPA: single-stranded DNA-binding protein [Bacteroidales bacterium]|nr:single-stranded DNA-binding protein [Bacteroidales bacterium]
MSVNKVILVGNVGKDPVVRYFEKGVAKATFPLATSETYTSQQGETVTSTEWHNIVLWRSLAEVAEKSVHKGTQVYIVGKIKTRSYVDKDGNNKYITEILADTMMVLDKKQGTSSGPSNTPAENDWNEAGSGKSQAPTGKTVPSQNNNYNKDIQNQGGLVNEPPKAGYPFDEGIPPGKNDDDLPF